MPGAGGEGQSTPVRAPTPGPQPPDGPVADPADPYSELAPFVGTPPEPGACAAERPAQADGSEPVEAAATVEGTLPVAAVARRLGVAPATLRTWDRRYGLGPSVHSAGAHRRYTAQDVALLATMRRLTLEGVAPAEAARLALAGGSGAEEAGAGAPASRRGGPGGRVLALPRASATVVGLGRAAMALDSETVLGAVRSELAASGVVPTWEHVLRPVLSAVGARWAATGDGVEVEHLLSECVTTALRDVVAAARPTERWPVLLAGAPDDPHALPLHAVAAALAEQDVATRVLGSAMPAASLYSALRRTGAAALFVWSQLRQTGGAGTFAELPAMRPAPVLVAGGPGWHREQLPARVLTPDDLHGAVQALAAAAR